MNRAAWLTLLLPIGAAAAAPSIVHRLLGVQDRRVVASADRVEIYRLDPWLAPDRLRSFFAGEEVLRR